MPARVLRVGAGVIGACLALAPSLAAANTGSGSLSLQPAHGLASAYFTATFHEPSFQGLACPALTVSFSWDSSGIGSAPLAGPDGAGNCDASISARPPAGDAAPGGHQVVGDDGAGNTGNATYTVDRPPGPAPSSGPAQRPSPSPSPKASPSPRTSSKPPATAPAAIAPPPSPIPMPTASASPAPGCDTYPAANPVPDYRLASFYGVTGDVQADPFAGWATISSLGPSDLVPPRLGHAAYPPAVLGDLSVAVQAGSAYSCVWVSLGPSAAYFYARYVFERVQVLAVSVGRVSFRYDSVYYDYLPRLGDGLPGREQHGQGRYGLAASKRPAGMPWWPWFGLGTATILAAGFVTTARMRR